MKEERKRKGKKQRHCKNKEEGMGNSYLADRYKENW
jgi:hypothetical protein